MLLRIVAASSVLFLAAGLYSAKAPGQAVGTAVEYYHAGFNHYFVTAYPDEAAFLDSGAFGGVWSRTGLSFPVWTQSTSGTGEACRFFSSSFAPRSSHFYTPFGGECASLRAGQTWQYEGVAFHLKLPDAFGNCPTGTSILYRLYNDGRSGAPNHRYTTSRAVFDQMRNQGWVAEGLGSSFAFACIPSATPTTGAHGLYYGSTNLGQTIWGLVLPEGTFYVIYSVSGSNTVAGVVQGSANFSSGAFASSNARDFNILPYGAVFAATVSGTYVPEASIQGTVAESGGTSTFSAQFMPGSRDPANLALAAGTYTGAVASSAGYQTATFTLTASGGFAGSSAGCTFAGTATPRNNVSAFDISIRFNGGLCLFGTSTLNGAAVYDASLRQMYGAAPNGARTDGFLFIGAK